jgi:hypothetical protein
MRSAVFLFLLNVSAHVNDDNCRKFSQNESSEGTYRHLCFV